jgi:hypothetical protein
MNPASPSVAVYKSNASVAIQTAHAALTEKAREAFMNNPSPLRNESPERSLIKHKRMQSIQTGSVRDLSSFLEGGMPSSPSRALDRSPERMRPITPYTSKDSAIDVKSPDKEYARSLTPTPTASSLGKDPLSTRPTMRKPPQSILGENTPPQSATMLALQSMSTRDPESTPLANVTNGSTALVRTPQTFEAISHQILGLTNIATSLQREMAQLSRRSKDNATDLVSLKEATNARDEDIRKSLRELVNNLNKNTSRGSNDIFGGGGFMIDNKPHTPSSKSYKPISLPRIPSPSSFAASLDRESMASPMSYHTDGTATIALLEKIIRDMGTKDGQDNLIGRLEELSERLAKDGASSSKKLDELLQQIKTNTSESALVLRGAGGGGNGNSRKGVRTLSFSGSQGLELDFDQPRPGPMVSRVENLLHAVGNKDARGEPNPTKAAAVVNEDLVKLIRSVKDSVSQGGGLTAEVKALVRELRGEVLGMGRELGRRLDQVGPTTSNPEDPSEDKGRIVSIVQESLDELKRHIDRVIVEAGHQSSPTNVRAAVDGQDVYDAVKNALAEVHTAQQMSPDAQRGLVLQKDDILEAVREAWEAYKPDIEVQHYGLEREELLACLKEGIQEYVPESRETNGATREEVFTAVVEGLKHFSPPTVESATSLTREEILDAVRECLEEFEFPVAPSALVPKETDLTREEVRDALREELKSFNFPHAIDSDRDLAESQDGVRHGGGVVGRLQEIMEFMREEFKAVSDEAKQNVAANGRDTEQVLDATKDGFEKLRADIESYVDRAADVTGRDEILSTMADSFRGLRADVELLVSQGSGDMLDGVKHEIEQLRESMATSLGPGVQVLDKEEILAAIKDGLDTLRADTERPRDGSESILSGTSEILDALQDGITGLRSDVEKIGSKPVDMTVNYEILDTLRAGLEGLRADIDRLREDSDRNTDGHGGREIAAITNGEVVAADSLKRNDIENLEVLITQLRIKVEALESMPPPPVQLPDGVASREDLNNIEEVLKKVQASVDSIHGQEHGAPASDEAVRREDVEAIETLLRNTKAKIDDLDLEQIAKKDQVDAVESLIREAQQTLTDITVRVAETSMHEDFASVKDHLQEINASLLGLKEKGIHEETTVGLVAIETICLNMRDQLALHASKDEVKGINDALTKVAESNTKAFEERQAEIVGVGETANEIKVFLEEFKDAVKEKFEEGATGVEALGKVLDGMGETLNQNAGLTDDIKALSDTIKTEFEKSNAGVVGAKLESDENFQKTWYKFEDKFNELMVKYDDAQTTAEEISKAGEDRAAEAEGAVLATKAIAEDLKTLIDTLGTTLTDAAERTDEASKTVFNRVEETYSRVGDIQEDAKTEHQATREQLSKAMIAVKDVQGHVKEYHPKILDSIKDVLLVVGQHYEHTKSSTETIQQKIAEKALVPDQTLLPAAPIAEKYNDQPVHEKLDNLMNHMDTAAKSLSQLDMLDQIHRQVMQTAAEVSEFVSTQKQRIVEDHDDKERAVEAATIELEKQLAQKERVESEVVGLREEEERLRASVAAMKEEKESLALQKTRLAADVSSLETALRIRREELHAMEARAEGLERRILEGVIDHSRALLISKSNKGHDAMNLKRVPSRSTTANGSTTSYAPSATRPSQHSHGALGMTMASRKAVNNTSSGAGRRNFSLNQITSNVPNGGFKRSHSVKAAGGSGALRKTSWGGALDSRGYGDLNKENLALKESDEESDTASDSGTMRRTSLGTSGYSGTDIGGSIHEGTEYSDDGASTRPSSRGVGQMALYE